jgi:hypothetical protein
MPSWRRAEIPGTAPAITAHGFAASAEITAFHVLERTAQRFDLALVGVLLDFSQFEHFEHFLHLIEHMLEVADDAVHVLDGVGHGLGFGGAEIFTRGAVNHRARSGADWFAISRGRGRFVGGGFGRRFVGTRFGPRSGLEFATGLLGGGKFARFFLRTIFLGTKVLPGHLFAGGFFRRRFVSGLSRLVFVPFVAFVANVRGRSRIRRTRRVWRRRAWTTAASASTAASAAAARAAVRRAASRGRIA